MPQRSILVTASDFKRLSNCIHESLYHGEAKDRPHVLELQEELSRATVLNGPSDVPADVITMRSRVLLRDLETGETVEYRLVYPNESNPAKAQISVLAPIGVAMLGYRVGDVIEWPVPRGQRRLRVEALVYQPEAAGDLHL